MNDLKKIEHLKTLCSFSYSIKDNFCESISFYDENNLFENTIRRNSSKEEIVKIVSGFPFLKSINLRKSRINYFPNFASKEIEFLDLSCNNIGCIKENQINLPKLKFLNLGSNRIKKIPDISHIPLEVLKLHKNPLENLPSICKNIKILNLFFNYNLKKIPDIIFSLSNLEVFSFGMTRIKKFPNLSIFKSIKWLILPHCEFELIPDDLCDCVNLEGLILAKNNIKNIPKRINNLKKLKILSLYYNNIQKIPDSFYELNLEKLSLYKNPLKKKKEIIKKLKKINFLKI